MLRARSNVSFALLLKYNIFEITFFQAEALETALYTILSTLSDIWGVEMYDRSISCIFSFHYSRTHFLETQVVPGTSITQLSYSIPLREDNSKRTCLWLEYHAVMQVFLHNASSLCQQILTNPLDEQFVDILRILR